MAYIFIRLIREYIRCRIYVYTAAKAVDLLMRYFEQSDIATSDIATPEDIQPLSAIKRRVDYMRYLAQKQTTIAYFGS